MADGFRSEQECVHLFFGQFGCFVPPFLLAVSEFQYPTAFSAQIPLPQTRHPLLPLPPPHRVRLRNKKVAQQKAGPIGATLAGGGAQEVRACVRACVRA